MTQQVTPCSSCIHYNTPLKTNPDGLSCRELDTKKKCGLFVNAEELNTRGVKIAEAILSDKTDLKQLETLLSITRTAMRDRSQAFVDKIKVGDFVSFERGGAFLRERVGFVNNDAAESFVLVGSELEPIRVMASSITEVTPGKTPFKEFRIFTAKQRERINKIALLNRDELQRRLRSHPDVGMESETSVTVYDPKKYTLLSASGAENDFKRQQLSSKHVSLVPHFVNKEKWIAEHIMGIRPEEPGYTPPKYAVLAYDIPHNFVVKHGIESMKHYADLIHPWAGSHDFVLFAKDKKTAYDVWCSMVSKYHADGYPKDGPKRFTIISKRRAFRIAYGEYVGRFDEKFFRFAGVAAVPLQEDEDDYTLIEEKVTSASGRVRTKVTRKFIAFGRARKPSKMRVISKKESLCYEPS